ncbi:hypothetical protein [Streptomyces gardneri]|uniref:hypothetical protein n=1 Tax=Streptomyces gardneri TaxID=66892 RepID=UPI0035DDF13A
MTDVSPDRAFAAACEGLAVLFLEKRRADQAGGDPETDDQLDALLDATTLIARDAREDA